MEAVQAALMVLQILGAVNWTPQHKQAECLVFRTADEMAAVWVADGGRREQMPQRYDEVGEIRVFEENRKKSALPGIDFTQEMVLAAFAGEKPTGGYGIRIEKVLHDSAGKKVYAIYRETAPGAPAKPDRKALKEKLQAAQAAVDAEDMESARKLTEEARGLMKGTEPVAVIQVLTYPCHVVVVKKTEGVVKFVKAGTEEAAKLEGRK
jgi:hypothetical protein